VAHSRAAGFALGALAVGLAALAALLGSTRRVVLNLGPGDTPFVRGFEPDHDVENKVGWHWTTYDAIVEFPLETAGSGVEATLRSARVFGEEAVAQVTIGDAPAGTFRARGGEIRRDTLRAALVRGPLAVRIGTDSHERRNMGLRVDTLTLEAVSGAPFKLGWMAALRPPLAAGLLFAGLIVLGLSPPAAGAAALAGSVAFAARANADLFGAWRQTNLAPTMILASTLVLLLGRLWLERRAGVERKDAVVLSSAALVTMLLRLVLVSHPDFYYPDLLTHARVVEAIREEGPAFFLHPAAALNAQGAWTKPVLGTVSSLPYAVVFHTPFAVLAWMFDLGSDEIQTALKSASTLISVLPVVLAGALAVRFSLPPPGALVLCVIPVYFSRLSFALLPALLGHVFDLVVLLSIATFLDRDEARSGRSIPGIAAALLAGHLAYTSGVVNEAVFMGVLVVSCLSARASRPLGGRLALAEAGAALAAFLLYYRHFVGDVLGLAGRLLGFQGGAGSSPASVYPVESFWGVLLERTNTFFGWPYVGLAILGLWLTASGAVRSRVVPAWGVAYLVLILLRSKIPDVFRYGHETLFLTPLVALLSGSALVLGFRRGGGWKMASLLAGLLLCLGSFLQHGNALRDQLGNAL
jgi:hypothetical protein